MKKNFPNYTKDKPKASRILPQQNKPKEITLKQADDRKLKTNIKTLKANQKKKDSLFIG